MLEMDKTIRREGREVEGRKRERQGADGKTREKDGRVETRDDAKESFGRNLRSNYQHIKIRERNEDYNSLDEERLEGGREGRNREIKDAGNGGMERERQR